MPGAIQKALKFLRGVRSEMKKVIWPNRNELISYTMVTIVTIFIVAFYIGLVDIIFSFLIDPLL